MRSFSALLLPLAMVAETVAAASASTDRAVPQAVECVLTADADGAARLAETVPGSETEQAMFLGLNVVVPECLRQARLVDSARIRRLLAGGIAERLYRQTYVAVRMTRRHSCDAPVTIEQVIGASTRDWPAEVAMAECLVARRFESVDRLIRSRSGSGAERRALGEVSEGYSACVDAGTQVALERDELRALLANALYRRVPWHRTGDEAVIGKAD